MRKSALIIANWTYEDSLLRTLVAPSQDADALAAVLRDPAIGGFEVQVLSNAPAYRVCEETESFFGDRQRDDLLLYYFSGHGVTDDDGQLYYAASNTLHRRMRSTAVAASWVNEIMNGCRSRRQVLLLDCCHAGAFARTKASSGTVNVGKYFSGANPDEGRGKFILTASDAFQYSFEGDAIEGKGVRSVFTEALVEGLSSGSADLDGDGNITLDELYSFVYSRVREKTSQQTPRKWASDVEGDVIIAVNPRPTEAQLPDDLQAAIDSFVSEVREKAIPRLDRLLRGKHRGLALAAHNQLLALVDDDSRRVSSAAQICISAWNEEHAAQGPPPQTVVAAAASSSAQPFAEQQAREREAAEADALRLARIANERAKLEHYKRKTQEMAEADRLAREKAEARRIAEEQAAREQAERIAAQKAEAKKVAQEKEEAERLARERAAAEKAQADRIAAEKAETERRAQQLTVLEHAERGRIAASLAEGEARAHKQAHAEWLTRDELQAARKAKADRLEQERGERPASEPQITQTPEPEVVAGAVPRARATARIASRLAWLNARASALSAPLHSPLLLVLRLACLCWFVPEGLRYLTGNQPDSPLWVNFPVAITLDLAWTELAAGILLALGIASRLAALALVICTFIFGLAFGLSPFYWLYGWGFAPMLAQVFANYTFAAFLIVVLGPGRFALGRLISRSAFLHHFSDAPESSPDTEAVDRNHGASVAAIIARNYRRASSALTKLAGPLLLCVRLYCGVLFLLDGFAGLTIGRPWLVVWSFYGRYVSCLEVLLGVLLVSGFASRCSALLSLLLITAPVMLIPPLRTEVIRFVLEPWNFFTLSIHSILYWHFRFWLGCLLILVFGPGTFSADRLLDRIWHKTGNPASGAGHKISAF